MPLTARSLNGSLDTTSCSDDEWAAVYKATPRADLHCRDCGGRLHAKTSPLGLRFLAHDTKPRDCRMAGETPEHRALKAGLAAAIRAAGGTAEIEASPGGRDHGGWRADVLATGPDGNRIAFEVQLASMSVSEGKDRTARYARDAIETVWVTTKTPVWLYRLPGVRVGTGNELRVLDGAAKFNGRTWEPLAETPLRTLMRMWIAGHLAVVDDATVTGMRPDGWFHETFATVWTSQDTVPLWEAAQQERRRIEKREADQAQARKKARDALGERQTTVLTAVVSDLASRLGPREHVWLGSMRARWDGRLPVAHSSALGDERTGFGCLVWAGKRGDARLHAVVCPVAGRLTFELGERWRASGVTVHASTPHEADRLASALGWPHSTVTVTTTPRPVHAPAAALGTP